MTLGEHLRERRKQLGKTLKDVATGASISIPYLSDVERDKAQPPLGTLSGIAAALDTTVTALLEGVEGFGEREEFPTLPSGLQELKDHPVFGAEMSEEWIRTLTRVDYRGKRPETFADWLKLHTILKSMIGEERTR
jgi:XRE family transcriptional regulator, regulator of sulfur utilization